ncbi:membrane protein [Lysobacter helvus]|uniref:Membrane protein n=2 Tax=Lysobacteraceae TaxID=32033 RepID=A0ABM7Q9B3_9GAMM|nr:MULTISPECIES: TonB-dependent receptor [Lysobacter]BCT94038.1 membrane protein [Lysobacter caseinilyticus]BCT97194.1 membrane protein [Lysobacter helvus]
MKPRTIHRPTPRLLAVALASCVLALGAPAFAQSTSATLRGAATASTRVTATNTATGLSRSVQAGADGNYILAGLPPGVYRVDVEGGQSRTVTLSVGQNVTLNVAGGPAQLQSVEVVGAVQETRTSEVATYVTPKKIESLPQSSRNFLSFADTVPGVIFDTGNDDSTKLRSGAQNSNGVNVFIDGVGQKNYVLKGGISGQDSSRGNPFPQLAVGEYKVITSNYKAEYDQISSAAVTAVTKSGTNDFGGSVFWDRTSDFWRSMTPAEERAGVEANTHTEQYGMSVGGPILKDRLFYFVTYEGKSIDSPRTITPGQMYGGFALPANLQQFTGPLSSPFDEDLWFGKLTWQPDGDNLVELSLKQRNETEITGIGGQDTFDYGTSKQNDSTRVDLRWQYNQEQWLNDAHITFENEQWSPRATTIGPGFRFTGTTGDPFQGAVLNVGGGRDFQDKGQKGWSLQDDFSYFGFEGHTMKAGFKYKTIDINAFEQQPYNPQYSVDLPEQIFLGNNSFGTYVPWRVQFGAQVPGSPSRDITTKAKQFGIYFQDDWQVTEKLMLNLGLRWDYERSPGYENYVTPPNLVAALRAWPNIHGPNVDYNIENYISDGNNRDAFTGAWQPRLGFSYDLFADERHVIFGGAGRTYDRNLWDYLALEQSKSTFPTYELRFNTPTHPCNPATDAQCFTFNSSFYDPNTLYGIVAATPNLGAEVNLINNDLKTPYSDQFSLGMRNSFGVWGQEWQLSTTYVHIVSKDGIVFSLGNRWPDGSFRNPAVPGATWGNQPFGFPIPGFGTLIKADNGIETKLNQFLVSLEKTYTTDSPWSITFAYTYSDSKENRFNAANSDEHYLFDYPSLDNQPFLMSVGVPKNRLVVSGFMDTIWDMTFSGKLTVSSPYPKDSVNCHDTTSFNNCFFDEFVPDGTYGFKQLDLALRKSFDTQTSFTPWVRVDVLNVFDWHNWTDYDTWRGGPVPDFNPTFGDQNGYNIQGPPRTFKLSVGFDF